MHLIGFSSSTITIDEFCCHLTTLFKNTFSKNSFRNTIRVSNPLDPENVGPDLLNKLRFFPIRFPWSIPLCTFSQTFDTEVNSHHPKHILPLCSFFCLVLTACLNFKILLQPYTFSGHFANILNKKENLNLRSWEWRA